VSVSAEGLAESNEWHRASGKGVPRYEGESDAVRGERAVLIQSESHIATLCEQFPELRESFTAPGAFGENVLASGDVFDAKRVHIGDVFSVEGSTLLLQATSPRRPCANVDIRHGKIYGNGGVRAFCARTGCAGSFFRVLRPGSLQPGAVFKLQFRQPEGRLGAEWSLRRLSNELYATANAAYFVPRWTGSRSELRALCADRVLAEVEWKEVLVELLGRELEADGSSRAVRIASTVIWCALVACSWRYAPPVRPDWVDWCLDLVTMENWERENRLIVAEFSMLGLWPLIILAQCRTYLGYRPTWFAPPLWLPLVFGLCLGCFAVAPTLALYSAAFQCTRLHLRPIPSPPYRSPQPPVCAYGLLLAACGLW
jgi:MOSC domain-containing protein YiiM